MSNSRRALLWGALTTLLTACIRPSQGIDTGAPGAAPPNSNSDDNKDDNVHKGDSGVADTGPCEQESPDADWIALPLADYPELVALHGSTTVRVGGRTVLIAHVTEGCYVGLDQSCTHQGCPIAYRNQEFSCPCHGARFDEDGSVLSGPATRPVDTYAVVLSEETVWVSPSPNT